jgi:hypothetical protein
VAVDRETLYASPRRDRGDGRGGKPHFFEKRDRGIEDLLTRASMAGGSSALLVGTWAHYSKHIRLFNWLPSALTTI